jgi:flagellar biosynthetic protein FliQ
MTTALALELVRRAVLLTLMVAGPLLIAGLLVGVLVGLLQAVTQLQEQTLTFIPKVLVIGLLTVALMPWMLRQVMQYLIEILRSLPSLVA